MAPGCGTLPNGRAWGQDVTLLPGKKRLGEAFVKSVRDPWTWVPLTAAAVLAIDDLDERLSSWAIRHRPIYGSQGGASRSADVLKGTLLGSAIASSFATESGEDKSTWMTSKLKGFGVGTIAKLTNDSFTNRGKEMSKRFRPNQAGNDSFPSAHASNAFHYRAWTSRNLDSIDMNDDLRTTMRVGVGAMAIGTGWARVEGANHFPTDVLVGAALGHFVTVFIHDAFMGLPDSIQFTATVPEDDAVMIGFIWSP